ncbi:hypothetical protein DB313_05745 (plasmid) [Borrelia turcica IST7]|uniref:Uncharacterized protein n=1 Tax=Borrelia turcica IST7 TaxID=1104446 RepID=A0A386PP81_9SPIR|nr:DUF1506 family protein [Borrelia turcica]AYE37002.1 hypothetical protein DB313_05745 [Borrelia turcica IST7]
MSLSLTRLSASTSRVINHFKQELLLYKRSVSQNDAYKTVEQAYAQNPVNFTGSISSLSVVELDNLLSIGGQDPTSYLKVYTADLSIDIKRGDRISINGCFYLVDSIRMHKRIGISLLEMVIKEEVWE